MRVSRIAGDNGEHTDKVASVAIDEEEQQMESVNWDPCELTNFFDSYIDKLASTSPDDNAESWAKIEELEGSEITKLKERLALCRIRAHEIPPPPRHLPTPNPAGTCTLSLILCFIYLLYLLLCICSY